MAEYIEREEALACFHDWIDRRGDVHTPDENPEYRALEDLPATDVRPVVRAAWQSWEQDKPPCKWYSCDYCGFHALSKSNYCPHCGADMREENNE